MLTVWMMGIATALLAFSLRFRHWLVAPVLLVTLRAIQGFAVGGEWGGARFCPLRARRKIRKRFTAAAYRSGTAWPSAFHRAVSLISQLTTDEQFLSWGWRIPFIFSIVLVIAALWIRNGMEESAEFEKQQEKPATNRRSGHGSPVRHPGAFLKIIALRLCELLTMYIVTAFALNYSTQNLGLPRELFLNIGLLVGGISCLTIPASPGWRTGLAAVALHHRGADWHPQRLAFFMALEAQSIFWIVFFAIMLAISLTTWWCACSSRCSPNCLAQATATAARAWATGGKRGRWRIYAVYCRRAGDLLRRQLAQRGDLSAGRLPAVGGDGAADERDEPR